ncbi:hypothetical protein PHYPSEUDO_014337 [Phytophthora pseudosyringae]|uniref:Uncharacterized protein n=1 Tax=Phytophthora pseudosyringae TaxID=221518 RepID=A0A8T1WLI0_9STRA|nr:hypothetical protein PHYPSEUDO_014337 [Phytophthora pseudosyringae]
MAHVGEEATIVLSGIGTELSDGMLMNMYRTYGPIVRVRHNGTNSAQVIFGQKHHALKAVEATNGAVVYGKTLKVSLQRKFKKTVEPCRGFAVGICRKGDLCKYYHVTDTAAFASSAPPAIAKAPRELKKKTPKPKPAAPTAVPSDVQGISPTQLCRHFTRGFCAQGSECKFAHVLGLSKDAVPAPTGKVAQLCQFHLSGVCTRGDACRFIHQPKAVAAPEKASAVKASASANKASASANKAAASANKASASTNKASASANKTSAQSEEESESEAETEQNEEARACVECEKPGVAVWKCLKCDNSLYCDDCNSAVHRARVMAKHKRTKLPPPAPMLPRCGECESKTASVRCEQCEVPFCPSCDASVHKFKSLRKHTRVKLSGKTEKAKPKTKEEPKVAKKKEGKKKQAQADPAPQTKAAAPVSYVESVPQLEFSSDPESSESEDEEMAEASPGQPRPALVTASSADGDDEPMADASETESEEDFDDVKPHSSAPAGLAKKQAQASEASESESEPTPVPASVPKMELSSDSDSSDDEAPDPTPASALASKADASSESGSDSDGEVPSKPTPTRARKPTLAELSSESESDSDGEAPSKPVMKQAKKPAPKAAPAKPSSESSSDESEDEAPPKPAAKTKQTPAPKKKAASSSDSSDSSEDEAPPAKLAAKPTPAPRRAPAPARNHQSGGISEGSSHTLVKKIEAFSESGEGNELHLDANLNGFERLLAHDCAERVGLAHESAGSGLERHIIISRHGAKRVAVDAGHGPTSKKGKHHHH